MLACACAYRYARADRSPIANGCYALGCRFAFYALLNVISNAVLLFQAFVQTRKS